jgi:hypothetical protein
VAFLASSDSGWLTGENINTTGGFAKISCPRRPSFRGPGDRMLSDPSVIYFDHQRFASVRCLNTYEAITNTHTIIGSRAFPKLSPFLMWEKAARIKS